MKRMRIGAVCCVGLVLIGCAVPKEQGNTLRQEQRETVAGKSTADVIESVLSHPTPAEIDLPLPDGQMIHLRIPESRDVQRKVGLSDQEASASAAEGSASWYLSIPAGVKLILLAVGVAMFGGLFWVLRRSSKAVNASWEAVDQHMADTIHKIRTRATAETDAVKRAELVGMAADIERDRVVFQKEP